MGKYTETVSVGWLSYLTAHSLASERHADLRTMRMVKWGKNAPVVRCKGILFKVAHDDFKIVTGRFPGCKYGEGFY